MYSALIGLQVMCVARAAGCRAARSTARSRLRSLEKTFALAIRSASPSKNIYLPHGIRLAFALSSPVQSPSPRVWQSSMAFARPAVSRRRALFRLIPALQEYDKAATFAQCKNIQPAPLQRRSSSRQGSVWRPHRFDSPLPLVAQRSAGQFILNSQRFHGTPFNHRVASFAFNQHGRHFAPPKVPGWRSSRLT